MYPDQNTSYGAEYYQDKNTPYVLNCVYSLWDRVCTQKLILHIEQSIYQDQSSLHLKDYVPKS